MGRSSKEIGWRSVRLTGVSLAKLGVKKSTAAKCGSASRSAGELITEWDVEALEDGNPIRRCACGHDFGEGAIEFFEIAAAFGGIGEPGFFGEVRAINLGEEFGPVDGGVGQCAEPAILGAIRPAVTGEHALIAGGAVIFPSGAGEVFDHVERRQRLKHRNFDIAWHLAGALAMEQGGEHSVDEVQPGDLVGDNGGGIERRAVACFKEAGETGGCLDHVVVGGAAGIRAIASEADGGTIDQLGMQSAGGAEAETEFIQRILTHVVDQHVGGGDQLGESVLAAFGFEVEDDGVLVAVVIGEDGG